MRAWIDELRNYTDNSFVRVEIVEEMREELTTFVRRAEYIKAQVNFTLCTRHPEPYTLNPIPCTLHPQPRNPETRTLKKPETRNPAARNTLAPPKP